MKLSYTKLRFLAWDDFTYYFKNECEGFIRVSKYEKTDENMKLHIIKVLF